MDRQAILENLAAQPGIEVLVIGAGINGAGVFRDLAHQGLRVLLVDRGDYCSGTSSTSSHMAHGGIRYLENGEFRLVAEAVEERNRLLLNAPHLVRPLPTVIPMFRFFSGLLNAPLKFLNILDRPSERGAFIIKVGLMFYDALTHGQRVVPRHRFEGRKTSLERFPDLNPEIAWTACYYDGQLLSPERLTVEIALDGLAEGDHAMALTHAPVLGVDPSGRGVRIGDKLSGREFTVLPKIVVNATGPWIDRVNRGLGLRSSYIGGTKGSHLVLDNPELLAALGGCEFFFENSDGRIVLLLPWFDKVLVGTSDLPCEDCDEAICTEGEVDYFIGLAGRVFPGIPVRREDIVFAFSGVRPLPRSTAKLTGQISRDHSTKEDRFGELPLFSLVGGKWTTFRAFAEQVTDRALAALGRKRVAGTGELPIGGGRDYPRTPAAEEEFELALVHEFGLSFDRARSLFGRYGTRARPLAERIAREGDIPLANAPSYSRAEIGFLVETEGPLFLDDLVLRRSTLGWLGEATPALLGELAPLMGAALGWPPERARAEAERVARLFAERHMARA